MRALLFCAVALALAACLDFKAAADLCAERGRCQRPRVACPAGGFCWENPYPSGENVWGLSSPGPGELWAVGEGRSVLHLADGGWELVPVPESVCPGHLTFFAVGADEQGRVLASANDCGAGVSACHAWRDDGPWVEVRGAPGVCAVAVTSEGFFIAGKQPSVPSLDDGGAYLGHLDSTDPWTWGPLVVGDDFTPPLERLTVTDRNTLWAAGDGRLVRVAGRAVELDVEAPDAGSVRALVVDGQGRAMVAGDQYCAERSAAGLWSTTTVADAGFAVVGGAVLGDRPFFAMEEGELLSCEPGSCTACSVRRLARGAGFRAVASNGSEAYFGGADGRLFRLDADGGATDLSPGSRANLLDLWDDGAGGIWAVGVGGTLLKRARLGWTEMPTGSNDTLRGVAELSNGEVVIVGSGTLGIWQDGGVSKARLQTPDGGLGYRAAELTGLASTDLEHTWAYGKANHLFRYRPAEGVWRQVLDDADSGVRNWSTAWAHPSGVLWLGSQTEGVIRRVEGAAFQEESLGTRCPYSLSVSGLSADELLIACDRRLFWRHADGRIEDVPEAPPQLGALVAHANGPEDIWVLASNRTFLAWYHREPKTAPAPSWEIIDTGLSRNFALVTLRVAPGSLWVVGSRGVVMRRTLTP